MISPGQIAFVNSKSGWFGKFVKFFTKSKLTHTFVCFYPVQGVDLIFEANERCMLSPYELDYLMNDDEDFILYEVITDKDKAPSIMDFYLEYSNVAYGYTQLIWFMWRWFTGLFGIHLDNKKHRKYFVKGILCSELVFYYLQSLNIPALNFKLEQWNANSIDPQELFDLVRYSPELFREIFKKGTTF
jgi:hypothetical protein